MSQVFDDRICQLGEGPLWHPERQQLFWFDILGKRLLSRVGEAPLEWSFDESVSAAGWVDTDRLLIASASALFLFDVETGAQAHVCDLEAETDITRSNDGRADPFGGFWIGSMGRQFEPGAGSIWRFYKGELRKIFADITVSNGICFSPDQRWAYFCDTRDQYVRRVALGADGWPDGKWDIHIDLRKDNLNPDGGVVDAEGNYWSAQWGASRVACYDDTGDFVRAVSVPAVHSSCPAFGGPGLSQMFVTSAAVGLDGSQEGQTFVLDPGATGQAEHRVIL